MIKLKLLDRIAGSIGQKVTADIRRFQEKFDVTLTRILPDEGDAPGEAMYYFNYNQGETKGKNFKGGFSYQGIIASLAEQ